MNINIKKIAIGYIIAYLIIFIIAGVPKLLESTKGSNIEFAFNFPLLLTILPFKIIPHYPETIVFIIIFVFSIFLLQKKFLILNRLSFIVFMFLGWEAFGFLSMVRQAIDY